MIEKKDYTKYEIARILGARALQIAMDAPLLLKISEKKLKEIRYDPLQIAELEFEKDVLPITIERPFPKRIEQKLKREKEIGKKEEIEKIKKEKKEEEEIKESGEIMELAKSDEELEKEKKES